MAKLTIARKGPNDTYLVLAQLSTTHLPEDEVEEMAEQLADTLAHTLGLPYSAFVAFRWDDGEEVIDCEAVPPSSLVRNLL